MKGKSLNKYERIILESFANVDELTISELFQRTNIPKRTLNRYLDSLIAQGQIKAFGEGRGRYYQYETGRYLFEYEASY